MPIDSDRVEQLFLSGVSAIETLTADLDEQQWAAEACGQWSAAELSRHVLAVSRWYHGWLDRAIDGISDPPFGDDQLAPRNDAELAELVDLTGPDAVTDFAISARDYLVRVRDHWNTPFGYPYGTVTAGLHAGVAATEWHLHAWDLGQVTGVEHRPVDAEGLFLAAGLCVARAEGRVRGAMLRRLVPLGARRHPWESLLRRSGR